MTAATLARLGLAGWAAHSFATYDEASLRRVVAAVGGPVAGFGLDPDLEPVGVVVALTDSLAATVTDIRRALATGNAVLVCPPPSIWAAAVPVVGAISDAATSAGAPLGLVSIVDDASPSTVDALLIDPRVGLVVEPGDVLTSDSLRIPRAGRTGPIRTAPTGAVPPYPVPSNARMHR